MLSAEVISAVAAVVSAIGGGVAAVAAMRSAQSARDTQNAASDSERRSLVRQVVLSAKDVQLEADRGLSAAILTERSRDDLATFSGGVGGSRHKLDKDALHAKKKRAEAIRDEGKLFGAWPSSLEQAPLEEADRVLTKLLALRTEASGMREDLEREYQDLERQCHIYREKVIKR